VKGAEGVEEEGVPPGSWSSSVAGTVGDWKRSFGVLGRRSAMVEVGGFSGDEAGTPAVRLDRSSAWRGSDARLADVSEDGRAEEDEDRTAEEDEDRAAEEEGEDDDDGRAEEGGREERESGERSTWASWRSACRCAFLSGVVRS
jgi:hypothetical protein